MNGTCGQSLGSIRIIICSVRDVSVALVKLSTLLKYADCSGVGASRQCWEAVQEARLGNLKELRANVSARVYPSLD